MCSKCLLTGAAVLLLVLVSIMEVGSSSSSSQDNELTELHIGGIFPINGKGGWWVAGGGCSPCSKLTIDWVWRGTCNWNLKISFIRRQGGIACMPAANLALVDVNGDKNLLPGFKLVLHSNDSEVRGMNEWIYCRCKLRSCMAKLLLLTFGCQFRSW